MTERDPNRSKRGLLNGAPPSAICSSGQVEIDGKRYLTAPRVSAMLGISERTLQRWCAQRIGPPKIQVSKTILYNEKTLATWLEDHEIKSVRASSRRR